MEKRTERKNPLYIFLLPAVALVMVLLVLAHLQSVSAAEESEKRTVRVGYYTLSNFQEYDASTKEYRGYSYDYLQALAQYADWKYEFVPVTYEEGLQMLADGQLDLMNNVVKTGDLSDRLSFSSLASGESSTCLVVKPDNAEVSYEDFEKLADLTVGLSYTDSTNNSAFIDYCKDNDCMPKIIYYHSWTHVLAGMASGEVNAYLISSLEDTDMRTVARIGVHSYYFAVTKGDSALLQELNVAMSRLKTENSYFEEGLYQKYHSSTGNERTVISESEKAFIASSPDVKVAYAPDWYPLSYTSNSKEFSGALASVFQKITEDTGLAFDYVPYASYEEAMAAFRTGKAQVFAGFPYDYTWAAKNQAMITVPFTTMTLFSAYANGKTAGTSEACLSGGYMEYLNREILKKDYRYQEYVSSKECLASVLNGGSDFAVVDFYEMQYYSSRYAYQNLLYKATGTSYGLSAAVSSSADERIYSILSKALASIGTDTVNQILQNTNLARQDVSLLDTLYANRQMSVLIFSLLGFILAAVLIGAVYVHQMRKKNAELNRAMSAKSQFLSNMSHDMRTPLNGIIGYTGLARDAAVPEKKEEYLNKIKISGEFLLNLINDTLDISKIESGKFALNPVIVSSDDLIRSAVVPIEMAASEKGIHLLVDTKRAPTGKLRIDQINAQKIILNLLSNAVKFTPEGGTVKLVIEKIEPPEGNKNCRIIVEDNGIGMDEEFQKTMFEPFTQEYAPEARNTQGTGLGLSIVKKIVTLMDGTIAVKSEKNRGTRFEVLLPVEAVADEPQEDDASVKRIELAGKHILLCEDNEMNTEIAVKVMESRGLIVDSAPDGKAGVAAFASSAPGYYSAVLMDLRMPVMDGIQAAAAIRALDREDAGTVPILAMSADSYDEDVEKCRQAGMNGHISKPVDNAVLFSTLEQFCGGKT